MALFGFINDRERVTSIAQNSQANADTAVTKNFDVISDTVSFKADQAIAARDAAFQKTMDKMMPALGGVADGLTSLMTQYPGYTTAVAAAAAAVTGLAGAAGLAALALGKGGLPGGMGLPSSGAGGPGKTGGKMGLLKGLGKAGGALGLIGLMGDLFFNQRC